MNGVGLFAPRSHTLALFPWIGAALCASRGAQTCGGIELFDDITGTSFSSAFDVSGDGLTVVGSTGSAGSQQGFSWTEAGGLVSFGAALPDSVNHDGTVLAGSLPSPGQVFGVVARWTAGTGWVPLTDAGGAVQPGVGEGISADGNAIVGGTSGAPRRPLRWTAASGLEIIDDGGITMLGSAYDVSDDGNVIVGFGNGDGFTAQAWRWTPTGGAVSLGTFRPGNNGLSSANAVSADGSVVVGYAAAPGFDVKPFVWTAATGLVDVYPDQVGSDAYLEDITADGTLAVGYEVVAGVRRPLLWSAQTGVVLLDPSGIPSVSLRRISDEGGVAIGWSWEPPLVSRSTNLRLSPIGATYCQGAPAGPGGCIPRLFFEGSSVLAADDATLRAENLEPGAMALFAVGTATAILPCAGGAIGTLCLGGRVGRIGERQAVGIVPASGTLTADIDLADLPRLLPTVPGETLYFQTWSRLSGSSARLTDAVAVTFQ